MTSSAAMHPRAGGLTEYGDVVGIPAERNDVVLHPAQGRELVEDAPVVRCAVDVGETFCADPVVHAD
jgi:hypothetical protein